MAWDKGRSPLRKDWSSLADRGLLVPMRTISRARQKQRTARAARKRRRRRVSRLLLRVSYCQPSHALGQASHPAVAQMNKPTRTIIRQVPLPQPRHNRTHPHAYTVFPIHQAQVARVYVNRTCACCECVVHSVQAQPPHLHQVTAHPLCISRCRHRKQSLPHAHVRPHARRVDFTLLHQHSTHRCSFPSRYKSTLEQYEFYVTASQKTGMAWKSRLEGTVHERKMRVELRFWRCGWN